MTTHAATTHLDGLRLEEREEFSDIATGGFLRSWHSGILLLYSVGHGVHLWHLTREKP